MSRKYEMHILAETSLEDQKAGKGVKVDDILDVIRDLWCVDTNNSDGLSVEIWGQSSLTAGETEEEFADRIAKAIWEANGEYCDVTVHATYLESLPLNTYFRSEDDYERIMEKLLPE